MKHPLRTAALFCAALLLAAFSALAQEAPAANAFARETVKNGEGYVQRALLILDENGLPARVMERFEFQRPVTEQERQEIGANYEGAPALSADGRTVYALWTGAEVEGAFGGMDGEAVAALLAPLESGGDVYQTTALGHTLYQGGAYTLTLDALHFSPRLGLALSCTAVNGYTKKAMGVLLSGCAADGLSLPLEMAEPVTVPPGESRSFLVPATAAGADILYLMGVESVGEIDVRYRVLDGSNQTVQSGASGKIAVSGSGSVAAYPPLGEPLYNGDGLCIYDLGFHKEAGLAVLMIQRTGEAEWPVLRVDAAFDGVQEGNGLELRLEDGQRGVYAFEAGRAVQGVDFYFTPDHANSLRRPIQVTLGDPAPLEALTEEEEPLWSADGCQVRFAGVSSSYFADSDALLFECVNPSGGKTFWLYPAYGYIYLDGQRMRVRTTSAACYPGVRSTVALAVEKLAAADLSGYQTLEATLGLYTLEGRYLSLKEKSGGLKVALHEAAGR